MAEKVLVVPGYFTTAMKKNNPALATFGKFNTSQKSEYVAWISDAKTDATRDSRLTQVLAWMAEGKTKKWQYL